MPTHLTSSLAINYVLAALGEVKTLHSIMAGQRATASLLDPETKQVNHVPFDTPDTTQLLARLDSGCLLTYHLRGGDAFPGTPGVDWRIYGDMGEIRVTNPVSAMDIMHAGVKVSLQVFGPPPEKPSPPGMEDRSHEVSDVVIESDEMSALPHPAQNVGRIYEAFAQGRRSQKGEAGGFPGWGVAIKRHELIEEMWRRWDEGKGVAEGQGIGTYLKEG